MKIFQTKLLMVALMMGSLVVTAGTANASSGLAEQELLTDSQDVETQGIVGLADIGLHAELGQHDLERLDYEAAQQESPEADTIKYTSPIPEPAAAALLLCGLGSMAWMRYRLG